MQPKVLNNFLDKQTSLNLNNYLKSISIRGPKNLLNVYLSEHGISEDADAFYNNLIIKIIKDINSAFEIEDIILDRAMYQILESGDEIGWHTDATGKTVYQGVDDYTEDYYSALLYLTDDYGGGEIVFYDDYSGSKDNSTEYKPETGTLLYFNGDKDTPHSVNKITSGERANIILFYKKVIK